MSSKPSFVGGALRLKGKSPVERRVGKIVQKPTTEKKVIKEQEEKKDLRTDAEKRAHKQRLARIVELKEKKRLKGFKDKVEDFNGRLKKQSDHYDIPRIGPG